MPNITTHFEVSDDWNVLRYENLYVKKNDNPPKSFLYSRKEEYKFRYCELVLSNHVAMICVYKIKRHDKKIPFFSIEITKDSIITTFEEGRDFYFFIDDRSLITFCSIDKQSRDEWKETIQSLIFRLKEEACTPNKLSKNENDINDEKMKINQQNQSVQKTNQYDQPIGFEYVTIDNNNQKEARVEEHKYNVSKDVPNDLNIRQRSIPSGVSQNLSLTDQIGSLTFPKRKERAENSLIQQAMPESIRIGGESSSPEIETGIDEDSLNDSISTKGLDHELNQMSNIDEISPDFKNPTNALFLSSKDNKHKKDFPPNIGTPFESTEHRSLDLEEEQVDEELLNKQEGLGNFPNETVQKDSTIQKSEYPGKDVLLSPFYVKEPFINSSNKWDFSELAPESELKPSKSTIFMLQQEIRALTALNDELNQAIESMDQIHSKEIGQLNETIVGLQDEMVGIQEENSQLHEKLASLEHVESIQHQNQDLLTEKAKLKDENIHAKEVIVQLESQLMEVEAERSKLQQSGELRVQMVLESKDKVIEELEAAIKSKDDQLKTRFHEVIELEEIIESLQRQNPALDVSAQERSFIEMESLRSSNRELELELGGKDAAIEEQHETLERLKSKNQLLEQELKVLEMETVSFKGKEETYKLSVMRLETLIQEQQKFIGDLTNQLNQMNELKSSLHDKEYEIRSRENELKQSLESNKRLSEEVVSLNSKIEQLSKEKDDLFLKYQDKETQLIKQKESLDIKFVEQEKKFQVQTTELSVVQSHLDFSKKNNMDLESQLKEVQKKYEAETASLQKQIDLLQRSYEDSKEIIKDLKQELSSTERSLHSKLDISNEYARKLEVDLSTMKDTLRLSNERNQYIEQQLSQHNLTGLNDRKTISQLEEKLQQLSLKYGKEKNSDETRIEELESTMTELEKMNESLKERESDLEANIRSMRESHSQRVQELTLLLKEAEERTSVLNSKLNNVSNEFEKYKNEAEKYAASLESKQSEDQDTIINYQKKLELLTSELESDEKTKGETIYNLKIQITEFRAQVDRLNKSLKEEKQINESHKNLIEQIQSDIETKATEYQEVVHSLEEEKQKSARLKSQMAESKALFSDQIKRLKEEASRARDHYEAMEKQVETQKVEFETKLEISSTDAREKSLLIEQLKNQNADLVRTEKDLLTQINALSDEKSKLVSDVSDKEMKLLHQTRLNEELKCNVDQWNKKFLTMQSELFDLQSQFDKKDIESSNLKFDNESLRFKISELEGLRQSKLTELNALNKEMNDLKKRESELQSSTQRYQSIIQALQQELSSTQEELKSSQELASRLKNEDIKTLNSQLQSINFDLAQKKEAFQSEISSLEDQCNHQKAELGALRSKISDIEQLDAKKMQEIKKLRQEMSEMISIHESHEKERKIEQMYQSAFDEQDKTISALKDENHKLTAALDNKDGLLFKIYSKISNFCQITKSLSSSVLRENSSNELNFIFVANQPDASEVLQQLSILESSLNQVNDEFSRSWRSIQDLQKIMSNLSQEATPFLERFDISVSYESMSPLKNKLLLSGDSKRYQTKSMSHDGQFYSPLSDILEQQILFLKLFTRDFKDLYVQMNRKIDDQLLLIEVKENENKDLEQRISYLNEQMKSFKTNKIASDRKYANEISELQAALSKSMNEINQQQVTHEEELKELKESLRHRFEQHSDKLGKNMEDFMTQEKEKFSGQIREHQAQTEKIKSELQSQISTLEEENRLLGLQLESLKTELEKKKQVIQANNSRIASLESGLNEKSKQLDSSINQLEKIELKLAKESRQKSDAERMVRRLKTRGIGTFNDVHNSSNVPGASIPNSFSFFRINEVQPYESNQSDALDLSAISMQSDKNLENSHFSARSLMSQNEIVPGQGSGLSQRDLSFLNNRTGGNKKSSFTKAPTQIDNSTRLKKKKQELNKSLIDSMSAIFDDFNECEDLKRSKSAAEYVEEAIRSKFFESK